MGYRSACAGCDYPGRTIHELNARSADARYPGMIAGDSRSERARFHVACENECEPKEKGAGTF